MQIEPPAADFVTRYERGEAQVVWTTLVADLETPVSAFLKIAGGRAMSFLLESVEGGAVRGRYSIIGLEPDLIWRTTAGRAEVNRAPRSADSFTACGDAPLAALRALIAESRIELPDALPPMAAGIFGYLGYDMVRLMEELPAPNPDPIGIPDAILVRPTIVVVFDAVRDTLTAVTPVRPEQKVSAKIALARASERLAAIVDALDKPLDHGAARTETGPLTVPPDSNTTPAEYERMVHAAKDYIAAGDVFQVVLSQRFSAPFELPPFALYRALRRVNPSPYLYFLDFGTFAVAGSSPEILVKVSGRHRHHPSDRRNAPARRDAARRHGAGSGIAFRPEGTRRASDAARSRPQRRRARRGNRHRQSDRPVLRRTLQPGDAHRVECRRRACRSSTMPSMRSPPAFLPAPSPARRRCAPWKSSMNWKRKSAGSMPAPSAISPPPARWTPAIVLRTALVKDGVMYVQAGAGIVADSDPKSEQQECVNKAKALFRAAEEARRFASAARRGQ